MNVFHSFCITPTLLAVCLCTAHAQTIELRQLGDNELTCQEIYNEVKQMDAHIAANAPSAAPGNSEASNTARALSDAAARDSRSHEVAQFGNFLNRITGGLTQQNHQQTEAQKAQLRDSAMARKRVMTSLFNEKRCKMSAIRK
jgi:hypothetical protein